MKNFILKLLFSIVLLAITYFSYGQTDSLTSDAQAVDKDYTQVQVDSMVSNMRSKEELVHLKRILSNNRDLNGWTYIYRRKAAQAQDQNKFDSTLIYGDLAIRTFENSENKRNIDEQHLVNVHYNMARALYDLKRYEEAIVSTQKALDLNQKHPYKWVSFITAEMANIHLGIGNDSIALSYYRKTLHDSLYMTLARPAVTTYTRMGFIFQEFQKLDSARYYFRKGVELSKKTGYESNLYALYFDIGNIFDKENRIDSCLFYYRKAVEAQSMNPGTDKNAKILSTFTQSYIDFHENSRKKALDSLLFLKSTFSKQQKFDKGDKSIVLGVFNLLKKIYVKNNNINELDNLFDDYENFTERFYDDQLSVNLENAEIRYQTKQKDASIASLEQSNQQQEVILEQQGIINWILGGLLLSFIGIGFLFFKQRKQKEKYKTANLEQRLLRSQLNPHFLFNALNTASSLAHQKSEKTTSYIAKLGNLLRSVLENSREEFISLDEEIETLESYLVLQSDFSKKFKYTIDVERTIDREGVLIPPMFIQPFLENAIQHGFKGAPGEEIKIVITTMKEGSSLLVEIENNGEAYSKTIMNPKDDEHNSLSGKILKERLAIYAKSYKTKSHYTIKDLIEGVSGTKVNLYLPLVKDV